MSGLPGWVRPNSWAFHSGSATIFAIAKVQRHRETREVHLVDSLDMQYPLSECELLKLEHCTGGNPFIFGGKVYSLASDPRGLVLMVNGQASKLVTLPTRPTNPEELEAENAARSLAMAFGGVMVLEDDL